MSIYRDMDDVVEAVRNAKGRGRKCAILIGAGCSVTANIPSAAGIVDMIEKDWRPPTKGQPRDPAPQSPAIPFAWPRSPTTSAASLLSLR